MVSKARDCFLHKRKKIADALNLILVFVQKLYSSSQYGNMNSDFIMIVANMCGVALEEEVVEKGSKKEQELMKQAPFPTFPMLEVEPGHILCDTQSIATYLSSENGQASLTGSNF